MLEVSITSVKQDRSDAIIDLNTFLKYHALILTWKLVIWVLKISSLTKTCKTINKTIHPQQVYFVQEYALISSFKTFF